MKHILLTGATGFLGSHLLEALLTQGYKVTILRRSTSNSWRIDHLLEQVSAFDVDQVDIEEAFKAEKVNTVIHTACSYGRDCQPLVEVIASNLLFGVNVLEAAISHGVATFINADTLLPKYVDAYSLSKHQFLQWLKRRDQEIRVVNLRLEHMYGPRDDDTKFVPWLIRQMASDVTRIPLTEGRQKRDFIYVDDVVSAYLIILQRVEEWAGYKEFDLGSGEYTSVRDFVCILHSIYKKAYPALDCTLGFGDLKSREDEPNCLVLDNTPLKSLGWTSQYNVSAGIAEMMRHLL